MTRAERIRVLDAIRGVAVLGMLVGNIPWHAGDSMSRVHDADASSVLAWLLQYLVFDQRFMPLFAMLFGASVLLQAGDAGNTPRFRAYFARRMAVLFALGVLHAYLLWPGDILITYALCGPLLLLFMHVTPRTLLVWGVGFICIDLCFGQWPEVYSLTLERWLFAWWVNYGEPPSTIAEAYAGSYGDLFAYNAWRNQFLQWTGLPYFRVWYALGFMLVGMALFRLGILQGRRHAAWYRSLALACLVLGLPLLVYGVAARIGINETVGPFLGVTAPLPLSSLTYRVGCAVLSIAVLATIHVIHPRVPALAASWIEPVGRIALTNYVSHSLIFIVVFHLAAPDLFDRLDHDALFLMVLAVWGLQVVGSRWWLRHFRQGPLEALWRALAGQGPKTQTG